MGITAGDVKFVKSQVMNDVPEGGGAPVAAVVQDAVSNAVFPDISELDRAGGRVNLRKLFAAVRTPTVDGFYGSNIIVAEPPGDPRVSVTLFSTGDTFDRRAAAASRMEAYLAKGPTYSGYLFGDHLAGQMSVTLLQRPEVALPVIGDTLVLRKNEGLGTQFDQFVRVTRVSSTARTFTDQSGDFKRTQVNLDLSDVLQADFPGFDALRYDATISYTGKTKISSTIVADAARYYGAVPLETAASIGDFTVKATGIYTQLVPSTRVEVPIADARMNQQSAALVKAGDTYSRTLTLAFTTGQSLFVGGGILPGSLSVTRGGITVVDKGTLLTTSGGDQVGTVDHANGVLTLTTNVFGASAGAHTVSYVPAAAPTLVSDSIAVPVTQQGQRLNYSITIDPPPARKSLQVSFRALGQWYVLQEDGSGAIRGADSSFGAGSLNYTLGTASVTLGVLPDVDSSVVFTYVPSAVVRPITSVPAAGPSLPRAFGKPVSLGVAIKPGTLSLAWNDGTARTATDAGGVLTGDATGVVNYAEGIVDFRPNLLPAAGTAVTANITEAVQHKSAVANFTDGGSTWTATLPAPLKANSVEVAVILEFYLSNDFFKRGDPQRVSLRLFDDGAGNLKFANIDANTTAGTVDYATGAISVNKSIPTYKVDSPTVKKTSVFGDGAAGGLGFLSYVSQTVTSAVVLNGPGANSVPSPAWAWWAGAQANALEARYGGADGGGSSHPFTFDSIFLPANANGYGATSGFVAKFSSFFIGTSFYALRDSDGVWQRDPSPTTGSGTAAGARAVIGGMAGALITSWPAGVSCVPTGIAGATQPDTSGIGSILAVDRATFRTAVAPLLNGGFTVAGNWTATGAPFSATADANGLISTGSAVVGEVPGSYGVFGVVDYEMGIATLRFGRRMPASKAADPYVIDLTDLGIPGVTYLESYAAQADTLRYNAVGYSYLPLNPAILGLDPVRLPADGRVPIFRPGTFAVIGNTATVGPATVANADVLNCARTRLSRVRVIGANGLVIDSGYTADLDTGLVTFNDVTGYSQPVTVEHRVEDMMLVSNAQINGQITFTRPVTHAYPPAGTYVSSALIGGDVVARTSLVFDQQTWSNVWADSPSGNSAPGTFNDAQNPIVVDNLGALTERWVCQFTNSTSFNVIGENVGVIAIGNTSADCAPVNPATGRPYFTIPAAGWGLGWATGNAMRFNTVGAMVQCWAARTILQGPETVPDDTFTLLIRGDVDRP